MSYQFRPRPIRRRLIHSFRLDHFRPTPFRRHTTWVHEGGISTPLIVQWPKGIAARDELRHDVCHMIDFVPTLLELAGAEPSRPAGAPPYPGLSLVPAFAKDGSVTRDTVFFNHDGNRALRMGVYKLVSARIDQDGWELYDLSSDRGEQHNLAAAQPDRVRDMAARCAAKSVIIEHVVTKAVTDANGNTSTKDKFETDQ